MLELLKRKLHDFGGYRGGGDCDCACAAPPNYQPVADASKESAEVMAALGREQLAEAKRQYDLNRPIAEQVVNAQLGLMQQTKTQGDDYYNYMVANQRPVESVLLQDALGIDPSRAAEYRAAYDAETANAKTAWEQQRAQQLSALQSQYDAAYAADQTARSKYDADRSAAFNVAYQKALDAGITDKAKTSTAYYLNQQSKALADAQQLAASKQTALANAQAAYNKKPSARTQAALQKAQEAYNSATSSVSAAQSKYNDFETTLRNEVNNSGFYTGGEFKGTADQYKQQMDALNKSEFSSAGINRSGSSRFLENEYSLAAKQKEEEAANRAMADARQGTTQQMNQMMRQGLRYGYSPNRLASMASGAASQNALGIASAANQAREKEKNIGYAKKMDVAGLYRGMPGASQGAYGLALNSGNSAVQNQMAPGNAMMAGMAQGNNTIGAGYQMGLSGLTGVMNAELGYANSVNQAMASGGGGGGLGGLGQVVGAGLGAWASSGFAWSDRRLKREIDLLGTSDKGYNIYAFKYLWSDEVHIGVMADEVDHIPGAVVNVGGYSMVNYACL